jgi:hypothetical protein
MSNGIAQRKHSSLCLQGQPISAFLCVLFVFATMYAAPPRNLGGLPQTTRPAVNRAPSAAPNAGHSPCTAHGPHAGEAHTVSGRTRS